MTAIILLLNSEKTVNPLVIDAIFREWFGVSFCLLIYGWIEKRLFSPVAQLARAPALHAGGQGFDSLILHHCPPKLYAKVGAFEEGDKVGNRFIHLR